MWPTSEAGPGPAAGQLVSNWGSEWLEAQAGGGSYWLSSWQAVPHQETLPAGVYDKLLITITGSVNANASKSVWTSERLCGRVNRSTFS